MKRLALVGVAAALTMAGCYKTAIHMSTEPGTPGPVNDQLHWSVIGFIELSAPINLQMACPGGQVAVIQDRESVLGGIVNLVLGTYVPILQVMSPSIDCTAGGAAPAPAGAADAPTP